MAVELASEAPAAPVALPLLLPPAADERTERALAVAVPEEAEARASGEGQLIGLLPSGADCLLTLAVLGTEGDDSVGLAGTASLVGAVTHTVAEVGLLAVAEDVVLAAAELGGGNAEHVVDAGALRGRCQQTFDGVDRMDRGIGFSMFAQDA